MYIYRNLAEIITVLLLLGTVSRSDDIKGSCGTDGCGNGDPELCDYKPSVPANCFDYEQTINTERDRQLVLDKLNNRRNKVAAGELRSFTPAADMVKLEWSKELETNAQRWANQCVKHTVPETMDRCRHRGSTQVGQNIATIHGESPGLSPQALVDVWYMELLNSNSTVIERYRPSSNTGYSHYDYFTQLVWAESTQVGCGGVKFKEAIHSSNRVQNRTVYKLVCNFAPAGNQVNQTVYTNGLPCTKCPIRDRCDTLYRALCDINNSSELVKITTHPSDKDSKYNNLNLSLNLKPISVKEKLNEMLKKAKDTNNSSVATTTEHSDDDVYTPFDFISHLNEFTRRTLATTTKHGASCKDVLAVDDFIDLLKKRLISNDFKFKELFSTIMSSPKTTEANFSDSNVEAFMSRIHRNEETPTTHRTTESEFINSTLLANLVEAVIFRNEGKIPMTEQMEISYTPAAVVNPIKIQAELAPVKVNKEFTGHYFFPEDDDDDEETSSETSEAYYDATYNIPASDIVLEIDDLKRNHATKDFIDDILESESATEISTVPLSISPDYLQLYKSGHSNMKKFLEGIADKSVIEISKRVNANPSQDFPTNNRRKKRRIDNWYDNHQMGTPQKKFKKSCNHNKLNVYEVKYIKLLKQLATDLKLLNLNEKYHCSHNCASACSKTIFILFFYILLRLFSE